MSESTRSSEMIDDQEILGDFVDEAREHLATISDGLLQMETDASDPEVVNSVFRALHTIKGVSSFIGLSDINELSHAGENVLDNVREETLEPTQDVIDALLETCDLLSALVDDAANLDQSRDRGEHIEQLMKRLRDILDARASEPKPEPAPAETKATVIEESLWPAPGTGLSAELVGQFVAENTDNLQELEQGLLRLKKHPNDANSINAVFRAIHSIKGTADYVGLAQIKTLSHHLESILQLVRSDRLEITPDVSDLAFETADALRSMIGRLGPDAEVDRDLTHLIARMLAVADGAAAPAEEALPLQSARRPSRADSRPAVFVQLATQHVESIIMQSGKLLRGEVSGVAVTTLHRSLSTLRNAADYMQCDEFVDPCEQFLDLLQQLPQEAHSLDQTTQQQVGKLSDEVANLLEQVRINADSAASVTRRNQQDMAAAAPAHSAQIAEPAAAAPAGRSLAAKSIRIDQDKLDNYLNLACELTVAVNRLTHLLRKVETDEHSDISQLKGAVNAVDRIAPVVRSNALELRMAPVKTAFQSLRRGLRDIAKAQGKKIDLHIVGEEIKVDKNVADVLGETLVHLVRNSADHGIETPEKRKAAGKSETGLITLKAGREGNFIVIDIIDDGAGINVERLKAKAVQNGLLTQEQADAMRREEALNLIFAAGLSTAQKVTDVSGRGVGMDVVRTNITNLGGTVLVTSEEGEGSQLRIQLPLTLAVTTALLVSAGEQTYAIPIEVVRETVKLPPESIKKLKGQRAITLRGKLVALKSLAELLGPLDRYSERRHNGRYYRLDPSNQLKVDQTGRVPIVVVDVGGRQFGFVVDELQGQQEIVLKPLPGYLARLPGLGSATVMGDGTIVLILDPTTLYQAALSQAETMAESTTAAGV